MDSKHYKMVEQVDKDTYVMYNSDGTYFGTTNSIKVIIEFLNMGDEQ
jgi:hypothetical protein